MKILLVEDDHYLARALVLGLRRQGYTVDHALTGVSGWLLAEDNDYALIILDLNLPEMDGLELCRRIRATQPHVLILMLTARNQPGESIVGLDVGADDYMGKPFHTELLFARIRALLRRTNTTYDALYTFDDLKVDPSGRTAWQAGRPLTLTRKEFAILHFLIRHPGQVVSQETLLNHIWDRHTNPLTTTVRVHVNALRTKLQDDAAHPRYIHTIIGEGYRLGNPAP